MNWRKKASKPSDLTIRIRTRQSSDNYTKHIYRWNSGTVETDIQSAWFKRNMQIIEKLYGKMVRISNNKWRHNLM